MKTRHILSALAIIFVSVIVGWVLLWPNQDHASHTNAAKAPTESLRLKIEPKNDADAETHRVPTPPLSGKTSYEQFKDLKSCSENSGTPESVLQDIAALRTQLSNTDPHSKTIFESEIRRKEEQLAILANCGVSPITKDELSRLLEKAAREGDSAARLAYAMDPMIDPSHSIENLDRLRAWRDTALAYTQSAANQGNPEAMVALAGAHDPLHCQAANGPSCPGPLLGQLVEPDAETAYRYYYESTLTGGAPSWVEPEIKTLQEYLSPDQIAAAQAEAHSALLKSQ